MRMVSIAKAQSVYYHCIGILGGAYNMHLNFLENVINSYINS